MTVAEGLKRDELRARCERVIAESRARNLAYLGQNFPGAQCAGSAGDLPGLNLRTCSSGMKRVSLELIVKFLLTSLARCWRKFFGGRG